MSVESKLRMKIRFKIGTAEEDLLEVVALSVAFLVPVLIRWIPEAQFPYPIGYDTPMYLAAAKDYSHNSEFFPLLYRILGSLHSMGLDAIVTMKYLPTLLYGFLGVSAYYFARSYLEWDRRRSLLAVLILTFSAVSLRISWDLNKQVFSTTALLIAFSQLPKLERRSRAALFIGFGVLVAASHEFIFALMSGIFIYLLASQAFRFLRKEHVNSSFLAVVSVAFISAVLVFLGGWFHWDLSRIYSTGTWSIQGSVDFSSSTWFEVVRRYGAIAVLCYAPLVPLGALGVFRRGALTGWILVAAIGSFSAFIYPRLCLAFPDRWMYLLIYPTAFFVANAFERLGLANRLSARNGLTIGMALILINFVSFSLLGISQWPTWYPKAPEFFPESMPVSSIPLYDIEATAQLMHSLDQHSHGLVLISHMKYIGWAAYCTNHQVIGWSDLWTPVPTKSIPRNVPEALDVAKAGQKSEIYLLWYRDTDATSLGFTKIAESGRMKLYQYHHG